MPPPKAEPLSEAEILTVRAWIEGGARAGEPPPAIAPYSRPLSPPRYKRPPVIAALAFSADGRRLFAGGYREVLVHDVGEMCATRSPEGERGGPVSVAPVARLVGEAPRIQALSLSPDGKRLAVASGSPGRFGELQLWEVASGELLEFRRIGEDLLYAVDFSPDGARLVAAGADRALHVLRAGDLEEAYAAEVHTDRVLAARYGRGGSVLYSGGRDRTLRASRAEDLKLIESADPFRAAVTVVLVRPGSDAVFAASESGEARFFSAEELKETKKLEVEPGGALAAEFSPDGRLLALGGAASEVRVYSADSGERVATFPSGPESTYALAFSPDGGRLAAAGYEGLIRLWAVKENRRIAEVIPVTLQRTEE
jgi:hypothetical protein